MNPKKCENLDFEENKNNGQCSIGLNGYMNNKIKLNPKPVNLEYLK